MDFTDYSENSEHFDESGFCRHCGWCNSYPDCHVEYDMTCEYINEIYEISIDDDGEIVWELKEECEDDDQDREIFLSIEGYDNYEISNYGEILHTNTGKTIKPRKNRGGYHTVNLIKKNKPKTFSVHRLVGLAFLENPEKKECIDHIDNCKTNNNIMNLRWVTHKENGMNRLLNINNSSGVKGVRWYKQKKKWHARIKIDGISIHLGYFDKINDAKQARIKRANEAFGIYTNACEQN